MLVARGRAEDRVDSIKLDWAYYNPISLVLKEKGLLEEEFKKDGIKIEWAQSLGSNKALELLRSKSLDFGSTAGAAAFLGRANGNPIKAIYVYSYPEWTALVTRPNSGIQRIQNRALLPKSERSVSTVHFRKKTGRSPWWSIQEGKSHPMSEPVHGKAMDRWRIYLDTHIPFRVY